MAVTDTDHGGKLTDDDKLVIVKEFHSIAEDRILKKRDRMRKAEDFKIGKQWDPSTKADNEARGKFCLTIPIIKPIIRQVAGVQIQNPKDFKVEPRRSGIAPVSALFTALMKQAMDNEQAINHKNHWFESGLTTGEGVLGLFRSMDKEPLHGNLSVKKLNEFEVAFDPDCKTYDPNDWEEGCKWVMWEPFIDKDKVEAKYPDQKEELSATGQGKTVNRTAQFINWLTGVVTFGHFGHSISEDEDRTTYRYAVNHTWWREWVTATWWYDKRTSDLDAIILVEGAKATIKDQLVTVTAKMIKAAKALTEAHPEAYEIKESPYPLMHHTIRVGDVFLEDIIDEFNFAQAGLSYFSLIPYYAAWDNGYFGGLAEDLIGTQEQINYTYSQELNIISKLANTGYMVGKSTQEMRDWLADHSGEDGIVIPMDKFSNAVEKIQPAQLPAGHALMTAQGIENARTISNVRTEVAEKDNIEQSGRAIALKQQASLTGSATMFANFDYSMLIAGTVALAIIQNGDLYSEDEIREIVNLEDLVDGEIMDAARGIVMEQLQGVMGQMPPAPTMLPPAILQNLPPEVQATKLQDFQEERALFNQFMQQLDAAATPVAVDILMDLASRTRRGEYQSRVAQSAASLTARQADFVELLELNEILIKTGQPPFSKKLLVEASSITNKDEILAEVG